MTRGFAALGLCQPKFSENVGGVLRAAFAYDVALVAIQGNRFDKQATDTTKAHRHIPVVRGAEIMDLCPYGAVPVAVELCDDAIPLPRFTHPSAAFYIFGPEDGSVPHKVLDRCKFRVMVPTRVCMNLACTVNVLLYDRLAKGDQ